jgi:hypothetical protein
MRARHTLIVLLILWVSTSLLTGQQKDFHHWSEYDCRKLITDSPWSQTYSVSEVYIEPLQSESSDRAREEHPRIDYLVQLRSAQPVRQALVRLAEINAKYEKLTAEQRKTFDLRTHQFLVGASKDMVTVHVSFTANVQDDDREVARYWRMQTAETLKNFVYMIGSGGMKIPLAKFVLGEVGSREFQLQFPREYQQKPVITSGDKTLAIEFVHPPIRGRDEQRVYVPFKVEKMMVNGELIY